MQIYQPHVSYTKFEVHEPKSLELHENPQRFVAIVNSLAQILWFQEILYWNTH